MSGRKTANYKKVEAIVNKWKPKMGLADWTIYINICKKPQGSCAAEVYSDLKYHAANIYIYPPFFSGKHQEFQERIVVHELAHLMLSRLDPHISSSGEDCLEEVTQDITMLIYNKFK